MKKIILVAAIAAMTTVFAAKDVYDIKPNAAAAKDAPISVEWENKNNAALAAATSDEVLAAFVADAESAEALLAQVKPAYFTDPMVACQIAAVSQWVMEDDAWYWLIFDGPRASGRKVWVAALMKVLKSAKDDYVKSFVLDQLRWCACSCCIDELVDFASKEQSKAVKDFAEVVIRELQGKRIG